MHHYESQPALARRLRRVLRLLERLEPVAQDGDVRWLGPHYIPRSRTWWPTRFTRYRDELYCSVEIGRSAPTLVWAVQTDQVAFDGWMGFDTSGRNGPELWTTVLQQVERRLRRAVTHPVAYNRQVATMLPLACRTGAIVRKWSWPARTRAPLSAVGCTRLVGALARARLARSWPAMTVNRFLRTAAVAYDAAFPDLRTLRPLAKYRRRADTRHGGMLDLDRNDPVAFERWYASPVWGGAHPWEIVFAHPHGVMLSPHQTNDGWRFYLSVDTLGLYEKTAHMATALGEGGVPFELLREAEVIGALRGEDRVEVGPFYDQLHLDELEHRRPGATKLVIWDPVPHLVPRTGRTHGTAGGSG